MGNTINMNEDPHIWLEEIDEPQVNKWVTEHNARTVKHFETNTNLLELSERLKEIMDSEQRIPFVGKIGNHYYNFWQDESNPKGILRKTTLDEYRKSDPEWEVVLDIDALSESEEENWVYRGLNTLYGTNRALVSLSRAGGDAVVVREFDLKKSEFLEEGFQLPEAKSSTVWLSENELLVATDFGANSMTDSGYPRIVKLWTRGEALTDAKTIFEGSQSDVSVGGYSDTTEGYETHGVYRNLDFYHEERFLRDDKGQLTLLDKPLDGSLFGHRDWIFILTKTDWEVRQNVYVGNSLLVMDREAYRRGKRDFEILFQPSEGEILSGFSVTRNHVIVDILRNVQDEIYVYSHTANGWERRRLDSGDHFRTSSIGAIDRRIDDRYWNTSNGFLTPTTLSLGSIDGEEEVLKQNPHTFDSSGFEVSQHWVKSADGTRVPYFLVQGKDRDGPQRTLLNGYGGFEIPMLPRYLTLEGPSWLNRGGAFAIANIRGGGEFGPEWHLAALKENRPRAYEDFIAIAEDLIERGVTTPGMLGISGGSNGGLLMGNMLTMRPDLFGAIAIAVPLLDMKRYHKLLAGASWMAEYGDPDDPEEWKFIQEFSPYHNLREDVEYPHLLITTSTRDDRVHPGHARKFTARLNELGHDVWYYENTEGGHAAAADNAQRAFMWALEYEFLWHALNDMPRASN